MTKDKGPGPRSDGEGGTSVAGVVGVNGCKMPELPPAPVHPGILTPEKLAAAAKRSEAAVSRTNGTQPPAPREITQEDYPSVPDPQNPGYMTNGLPVLPDTSEVVNGIRYSIPCFKPSNQTGRVVKRFSRKAGEKNKVIGVLRINGPKEQTVLRYDGEAECVSFRETGTCQSPYHRHARRNGWFGADTGSASPF
jgi:hypothetical protein